jgi:hypothetical protein
MAPSTTSSCVRHGAEYHQLLRPPWQTHARQAQRAYRQHQGEGAGGDDPRLAEWTTWWLEHLDLRPTTIANYRYKSESGTRMCACCGATST